MGQFLVFLIQALGEVWECQGGYLLPEEQFLEHNEVQADQEN